MFNESHELAQEFPEHKDIIHQLKTTNHHFARLFDEYHTVVRQVSRIEQQIDNVAYHVAEEFKKKRLALKDELFSMIKKAA